MNGPTPTRTLHRSDDSETGCDVLLVSELPLWPLDRGFRVHGVNMLGSLRKLGLRVAATTLRTATTESTNPSIESINTPMPDWLDEAMHPWPKPRAADVKQFALGWHGPAFGLRCKVAEHQALRGPELAGLLTLVDQIRPAAVIAVGAHGPVILRGLSFAYPKLPRLWYAADEPVSFQLSLLRREGLSALRHRARLSAVFGLMQVLFNRGTRASRLSAAIGVSPRDTRRLGLAGGCKAVTIRNGVDTQYFSPAEAGSRLPKTCAFWGDLSFEPNVDAVLWFAQRVWSQMTYRRPDARFTIMGRNPCEAVRALADMPGVELLADVPDLRPTLRWAGAAILPMRCGHGIKNKLLEAASLAMPILASPRAVSGLSFGKDKPPLTLCKKPSDWQDALDTVWANPAQASATGQRARQWVLNQHSWPAAAQQMHDLLQTLAPKQPIYYGVRPSFAATKPSPTERRAA